MKFLEYLSLTEGVNDPSIFKVVFLAGGPGSGKSFIAQQTGFRALGFVIINSDDAFEHMMRKSGLDFKMPDSEQDQRDAVRAVAKAIAGKKEDLALRGRLGLVIDGTGKDYEKITKMRSQLALKGYDAAMVFVNTDLETALSRNAKRERSVPEEMAKKLWKEVQNNLGKFQTAFGQNFFIVDNSEGADFKAQTTTVFKKLVRWSKEAPRNGVAKKWIEQQRTRKESLEEATDTCDIITQKQLTDLEKFGDRLLQKFDIDVEFTRHFGDRMSDKRNTPCIKVAELQKLFKKIAQEKGNKIKDHEGHEAVLKDIQSDLNLPFIAKSTRDGIELVLKTIMRKKNFKSPDPEVRYEGKEMENDPCWKDYEMVGHKIKNGKKVPNCVPKEGVNRDKVDLAISKEVESDKKRHDRMRDAADRADGKYVNEASNYDLYHKDFSSAVQHAAEVAKKRGYEIDDEDWFRKVASGPRKPSEGKTNTYSVRLTKDGKPQKKALQMQVYNKGGSKPYELNMYIESTEVYMPLYVQEAAYAGNIGMMELVKFYQRCTAAEKNKLQDLIKKGMAKEAWKLVQDKTGTQLVGKEFHEDVAVAANSVAGGGVDMNPTGTPKWDKRSKFHVDHMFKRADGTKYGKVKTITETE